MILSRHFVRASLSFPFACNNKKGFCASYLHLSISLFLYPRAASYTTSDQYIQFVSRGYGEIKPHREKNSFLIGGEEERKSLFLLDDKILTELVPPLLVLLLCGCVVAVLCRMHLALSKKKTNCSSHLSRNAQKLQTYFSIVSNFLYHMLSQQNVFLLCFSFFEQR